MNTMLKNATTAELNDLLDTLWSSPEINGKQADLMYAIVDELEERGDLSDEADEDIDKSLNRIREVALSVKDNAKQEGRVESPEDSATWFTPALSAALEQRAENRARLKKHSKIAAAVIIIILLVNTGTSFAWNINFLGDLFKYSGQAISSLFNLDAAIDKSAVSVELLPLWEKLDDLNIEVNLPTKTPDGYYFEQISLLLQEEPYSLAAWFSTFDDTDAFSITIDGTNVLGVGSSSEAGYNNDLPTIIHNKMLFPVYENDGRIKVIWEDNNYQIVIQGSLSYDDMKEIIESIME